MKARWLAAWLFAMMGCGGSPQPNAATGAVGAGAEQPSAPATCDDAVADISDGLKEPMELTIYASNFSPFDRAGGRYMRLLEIVAGEMSLGALIAANLLDVYGPALVDEG